jgi:hypothetical protein
MVRRSISGVICGLSRDSGSMTMPWSCSPRGLPTVPRGSFSPIVPFAPAGFPCATPWVSPGSGVPSVFCRPIWCTGWCSTHSIHGCRARTSICFRRSSPTPCCGSAPSSTSTRSPISRRRRPSGDWSFAPPLLQPSGPSAPCSVVPHRSHGRSGATFGGGPVPTTCSTRTD